MKSVEAVRNSSSIVSIRFLVSGPVSSHFCFPHAPKRGVVTGRVGGGRDAFQDPARTKLGSKSRILRIIRVLRLILGIQMVEVAEELIEAVDGRQKFVSVTEMVLAELSSRISLRLEQLGDGRIFARQSFLCSRQANFQKPRPQRTLAGDESSPAGGAGLLSIIIGENRTFVGNAIDVGRPVSHHPAVVGADVPVADVVRHNDENVRLLRLLSQGRAPGR